ncbi:MAG: hypothetical protein GTO67_08115 [Gammaproteobacteria bacterium]|nr:hypothetical protein [Gammaproteobacteria bacterium]NIM73008.1 hypothetical protein [Gammaproteobacteria bacterium]NIN38624.1 hypothetical protein [Gammaproteobacteria bacterium]NIO24760.1 hypothetical protein [Gammaproteobacteria bacterium]NIO65363.1 hypothetical protein [Gammaproteobacteria bacterium]
MTGRGTGRNAPRLAAALAAAVILAAGLGLAESAREAFVHAQGPAQWQAPPIAPGARPHEAEGAAGALRLAEKAPASEPVLTRPPAARLHADAALADMPPTEPLWSNLPARDESGLPRLQARLPGRAAEAKNEGDADRQVTGESAAKRARGPREAARHFLAAQERLAGLRFQPRSGYWANTYVPGDPAIRVLEARLQGWNRGALAARIGDARLETAVRQVRMPFDVPQNAALAAYLHADKRAVEGRSRLRVQVGLQASHKRSGLRPAMNVGVVLDLRRPLDDATGAKLRALLTALARARQPGDRFSITVAGHPGGLLVAPADFRHGPVRIAMQSLFADTVQKRRPAMDLLAALATATENVRQGDDASAPLGASLVLLVSTAPFTEQREPLERMAHQNAVDGIALSVVALGDGADVASIDRLVLLGQGHRRVLSAAEGAAQLVDRELHAASRAVARAVRLRIRLAPGVELVDVLGSENLSARAAGRVREAERSIDRRLARNVGIRADRGEDEEGIQIVMPSFFAGDSHAVLLDVVVPGPGPVADVSVRYKDLVYRRNGVARARLALEDGRRGPGPLQHNVLKNQLAHALARSAARAGEQLDGGDATGAVQTLTWVRDLLSGMRLEIRGFDGDDALREDVALLDRYLELLASPQPVAGQHRRHLADSLRYVAHRRLIPPYK